MCFKKRKNEPVRLEPKKISSWEFLKKELQGPELWIVIGFTIILLIAILFAFKESIPFFVYNRGL